MKNGKIPREVVTQVADAKTFRSLIYQIAANVPMDYVALQEILEIDDVKKRYEELSYKVASEMAIIDLKESIQQKVYHQEIFLSNRSIQYHRNTYLQIE